MKNKKIFILHGWAYSTERWKPFIDELTKAGFGVNILKIPGLTAPLDKVWNIDDYIEWLSKELKNEKDIILIGHSNGGLISIGYSLKYPNKVKQLILIDSTGIYHNELGIRLKRTLFMMLAKIGKKLTNSTTAKKVLYKIAREHDYENAKSTIVKKTMINLINTDYSQVLKNIRIPSIIIWGRNDQVTPIKDGKFMNSQIKNSKLFVIDDARHSPQLTNAKETAEIIINNI